MGVTTCGRQATGSLVPVNPVLALDHRRARWDRSPSPSEVRSEIAVVRGLINLLKVCLITVQVLPTRSERSERSVPGPVVHPR